MRERRRRASLPNLGEMRELVIYRQSPVLPAAAWACKAWEGSRQCREGMVAGKVAGGERMLTKGNKIIMQGRTNNVPNTNYWGKGRRGEGEGGKGSWERWEEKKE